MEHTNATIIKDSSEHSYHCDCPAVIIIATLIQKYCTNSPFPFDFPPGKPTAGTGSALDAAGPGATAGPIDPIRLKSFPLGLPEGEGFPSLGDEEGALVDTPGGPVEGEEDGGAVEAAVRREKSFPFLPGVDDRDVGELGPSLEAAAGAGAGVGAGVDAAEEEAMRAKSFPFGLLNIATETAAAGSAVGAGVELALWLVRSMEMAGAPPCGAMSPEDDMVL